MRELFFFYKTRHSVLICGANRGIDRRYGSTVARRGCIRRWRDGRLGKTFPKGPIPTIRVGGFYASTVARRIARRCNQLGYVHPIHNTRKVIRTYGARAFPLESDGKKRIRTGELGRRDESEVVRVVTRDASDHMCALEMDNRVGSVTCATPRKRDSNANGCPFFNLFSYSLYFFISSSFAKSK